VICRALGRISEGQEVYAADPQSYFFGIARNVLREEWKRSSAEPLSLPEDPELERSSTEDLKRLERRMLLAECLRQLPAEERQLILEYFAEGPDRLVRQMGISANALRIRIHRIKSKLEQAHRHSDETDAT
jgi:RNA polymerase sigma factor (sigma-70 family)